MLTFGSLFAGIGGIDLGLERAGWTGRWQVEWDGFCQHVLAHHWPDVPRYGDITRVDWSTVEPVDLIAGGFPCQPFSFAGKQRGVEDERWLWPEFARAIRALRPGLVLVENVPGLLSRRGGMGAVLGELAELGYDAEWDSIPAAAVGAPHLRYRVWVVAYANGKGQSGQPVDARPGSGELVPMAHAERQRGVGRLAAAGQAEGGWAPGSAAGRRALADPSSIGLPRPWELVNAVYSAPAADGQAAQPVDGRGPRQWEPEPNVGRVAHGVPARVDRLRALGNAVVPQIPELIGRRLLELMAERAA